MYDIKKSEFSDIFEENGLLVYDNENRSIRVKVAQEKDISLVAEFIYTCKQQPNDAKELDEQKLSVSVLEQTLRSGMGRDDCLPPSFFAVIALETFHENIQDVEHPSQNQQSLKCRSNIRGVAIITCEFDLNHGVSHNRVEEFYIQGETSDVTHAFALVLSAISLDGGLYFNHEKIVISSECSKSNKSSLT